MSRCYGIALVALMVGMPVAVWAGEASETKVVTDGAANGVAQKEKHRGGHARLGKVEPGHTSKGSADATIGTAPSTSAQSTSVSTTEGAVIE